MISRFTKSPQRSRSDAQYDFARIPSVSTPRSVFNRSCGLKTTFDSGYLVPIFVDEALPGDTFNLRMALFARAATPLHPVFENLQMETFFFAVPNRLVWENWHKFNGEQENPGDSVDFVIPKMVAPTGTGYAEGSLSDYFGIPTQVADLEHSALWHRAYNLIYNEWFRPQDIIDSVVVDKGDADSDPDDYVLLRRAKRHDYFTSCLPFPQKGTALPLPLGDQAPIVSGSLIGGTSQGSVTSTGATPVQMDSGSGPYNVRRSGTTVVLSGGSGVADLKFGPSTGLKFRGIEAAPIFNEWAGLPGTYADLSAATAATINELRTSFQVQRLLERDARGGTRYTEIVRSHFGVVSPDQRLQRPEYLGGGSTPVIYNPVAATSELAKKLGDLAAVGTAGGVHGFTKSFTEHCVIIGLVNIRADLNYQQGLDRMWSRRTRYDFYWPTLAHLGEQAVLQKEIYATGVPGEADDDKVFGYQERYAEYRYKPSKVTGAMRSNAAQPLDTWHLAQDFASAPVLSQEFIEENPPVSRIIATPADPEFLLDGFADFKCARPMPTYSVPGHIDHF